MKANEVPQDKSSLESINQKELCYATDENGNYITTKSSGWTPKTIALNNAIEDIKERAEEAKQRVLNNETSPIEYYMELNRMDVTILAGYVGIWPFRVKRHFNPKRFKKLSNKLLQKYADAFNISLEQLKQVDLNEN
ncbi:hypothetical protein PW52_14100 [Tamlana sedimentorum]|uniref:HTH cro/C1-type domain-containing protein n=1 Tax=Neotamlana sedimentorum TaxID=1435349 RepID=A0A0D7W409_9FLAO|nr:hypothetical protein [Tamlana sedimentorum]KJD33749.1 hypothetical protein PW52_14100 [Tamlana sedimentorum]